jgi:predicted DNA-binding transcriptional regulator AlpA
MSKNDSRYPSLIPIAEDRLLTTSQAAERLGLRTETLKKYRKATSPTRGPKYVRLNDRVVRYKLSELVAYISQQEVGQ